MLFRINSIQVQTPDGKQVTEIAGYSADSILQRMGVQLEENIFSFEPGEKAAVLEQNFPLLGSIKVIRDYPNTVVVQVTEACPRKAPSPRGFAPCTAVSCRIPPRDRRSALWRMRTQQAPPGRKQPGAKARRTQGMPAWKL